MFDYLGKDFVGNGCYVGVGKCGLYYVLWVLDVGGEYFGLDIVEYEGFFDLMDEFWVVLVGVVYLVYEGWDVGCFGVGGE